MSTLSKSRKPRLRDKHLAQEAQMLAEAEAKAAALEKVDEVEIEKRLKIKKEK